MIALVRRAGFRKMACTIYVGNTTRQLVLTLGSLAPASEGPLAHLGSEYSIWGQVASGSCTE